MGFVHKWPGKEGNNQGTSLLRHANLFRAFEAKTECKELGKALLKWVPQNAAAGGIQGQGMWNNAQKRRQPW